MESSFFDSDAPDLSDIRLRGVEDACGSRLPARCSLAMMRHQAYDRDIVVKDKSVGKTRLKAIFRLDLVSDRSTLHVLRQHLETV